MKILYTCLSKSWGGMEMYTLTSIRQLLRRNINCELLCVAESRMHLEGRNLGTVVNTVKSSGYVNPLGTLKVMSILRRGNYDFIHTQASKDLWHLVPALKLLNSNIPLFLTKHVGSFIVKRDRLHKILYDRVTAAFAISMVIKKNIIETTSLDEKKVILLPDGIDTEVFNPGKVDCRKVRQEFSVQDDEILIGMLGRFSPGKGHEEFIEAAKNLIKQHSNLKFLVVGEASRGEDKYEDKIKNLARKYNLNNLIFTGFRRDIPEVLGAMDIFVFPSHAEAFGLSLIEAMSMGKATVCSNTDGVLDIALDDTTSLLFESKNSEALQAKIEVLINSPQKRNEMGINGRNRVIENFDIEKLTDKVVELYQSYL